MELQAFRLVPGMILNYMMFEFHPSILNDNNACLINYRKTGLIN